MRKSRISHERLLRSNYTPAWSRGAKTLSTFYSNCSVSFRLKVAFFYKSFIYFCFVVLNYVFWILINLKEKKNENENSIRTGQSQYIYDPDTVQRQTNLGHTLVVTAIAFTHHTIVLTFRSKQKRHFTTTGLLLLFLYRMFRFALHTL